MAKDFLDCAYNDAVDIFNKLNSKYNMDLALSIIAVVIDLIAKEYKINSMNLWSEMYQLAIEVKIAEGRKGGKRKK